MALFFNKLFHPLPQLAVQYRGAGAQRASVFFHSPEKYIIEHPDVNCVILWE